MSTAEPIAPTRAKPAPILSAEAILALAERSGGETTALRSLARLATFTAELEEAPCVSAAHVEAAWQLDRGSYLTDADGGPSIHAVFERPVEVERSVASERPFAKERGVAIERTFAIDHRMREPIGAVSSCRDERVPLPAPRRTGSIGAVVPIALLGMVASAAWLWPVIERALLVGPAHMITGSSADVVRNQTSAAPPAPTGAVSHDGGPMLHVTVTYPSGDQAAAGRAAALAGALRASGDVVEAPVPTAVAPTRAAVGYFFAEDKAGAGVLADRIGTTATLRVAARDGRDRPGAVVIDLPGAVGRTLGRSDREHTELPR